MTASEKLEWLFRNTCGLSIEFNEHRMYYQSVKDLVEHNDLADDFSSPGAMDECVRKDTLVVIQAYPNTPVGFVRWAGPDLDSVVGAAYAVLYARKQEA